MNVNIRLAIDALLFKLPQLPLYKYISQVFYQKIEKKFIAITDKLRQEDEELSRRIESKIREAERIEAIHDVWDAPEFISRILDYSTESEREIFSVLLQAADAEIAQNARKFDQTVYPYLWTLNGDYLIQFDREAQTYNEYKAFTLNDTITLDFFSPNCIKIDGMELEDDASQIIDEYDYEQAYAVYEKLEESISPLYDFSNNVIELITIFTKVILCKKQVQQEPLLFSSASRYPYIGRSLLINAHKAGTSQIIDALVHESIHSLLYMIDTMEKWMPSNAVIRKVGSTIASPWTGKMLNPGNFCQAVFVWYGLFNFWQFALSKNIFDSEYGEKRLIMIKKGFEHVEIDVLNSRFNLQLNDAALETIAAVKAAVTQYANVPAYKY